MALTRFRMRETERREGELIDRARAGERQAFDGLIRLHFERVYSALFRLVGNHEDAEDLTQETFVRAFHSLAFFRGDSSLSTWLLRIAVHLGRDHHRSRVRRGTGDADWARGRSATTVRQPHHDATRRELVHGLAVAISSLPDHLREALTLRVLEGMEYEEVARATGTRPATVRTQVMKARRVLLRLLAPFLDGGRR